MDSDRVILQKLVSNSSDTVVLLYESREGHTGLVCTVGLTERSYHIIHLISPHRISSDLFSSELSALRSVAATAIGRAP